MGTIIFFLLTFLSIQNSLGLDEESSTQIGSNQVVVALLPSIFM